MSQWFINHRQGFIADSLRLFGQINRATLVERFNISAPQASMDIQRFLRENPDAMIYDGRCKTYVAASSAAEGSPVTPAHPSEGSEPHGGARGPQ